MSTKPGSSGSVSPAFLTVSGSNVINAGTGGASGVTYLQGYIFSTGEYEHFNQADSTLSSVTTTFPSWHKNFVKLDITHTVNLAAVNVSGQDPFASVMKWDKTSDNSTGGFGDQGTVYTLSAGEFRMPITATNVANQYSITGSNQLITLPKTISTGVQTYEVMSVAGSGVSDSSHNTSATLTPTMAEVNAEQANLLEQAQAIGISYASLISNSEG